MKQPESRRQLLKELRERTPESAQLWQRAQRVLPHGLVSGARTFEPYPFYTDRAQGSHIVGVDGNEYLDCCMSFGALMLGHRHPVVVKALEGQLERGTIYGTPHRLEVEFAENLVQCSPCAEQFLLCNSGTEATLQGIRIVRAYTGRDKIAKFEGGYHGWHDYGLWSSHFDLAFDAALVGPADHPNLVPDSAGIPEMIKDTVLVLPYEENAFAMIEEHAHELAAVMIEPVVGGWTLPGDKRFLERLRKVTKRAGILLFFDEVITGFRLALGGAQEFYGVVPDIVTYGKLIGGGLPVGAVGTSAAILDAVTSMDPPILVGGTFNGNPMTLAAGNAVLRYLMEHPETYPQLAARGDYLRTSINEFARSKGLPATMTGLCSLFQMHLSAPPIVKPRDLANQDFEALRDFQLFLRYNGVFIPRIHLAFLSTAHTDEDVEKAIRAHEVSLEACLTADHME